MHIDLSDIRLFVLDMDGTIYLEDRLFPYTLAFLQAVRKSGRNFCFFTNNSSKNRADYLAKLNRMGIFIQPEQMVISSDVLIHWLLQNQAGKRAYVVGTPALLSDFSANGIALTNEDPDYVVLGFDTTLTYEKLVYACRYVNGGCPLYGANPDLTCPVEGGSIPDCGSIAALVKSATGVDCTFFGKPSSHALKYVLAHTGYREEEIAVIGDRLHTDIALAAGSAARSILVLSGEAKREDLVASPLQPDMVCDNLGALSAYL